MEGTIPRGKPRVFPLVRHRNDMVGMQVPRQDKKAFREFLSTLNYPCVDETDNPAYQLFLR